VQELVPRHRKNQAITYRHSTFDKGRRRLVENRESRFPESTGAIDQSRDTWPKIPRSQDSGFGKVCDLVR